MFGRATSVFLTQGATKTQQGPLSAVRYPLVIRAGSISINKPPPCEKGRETHTPVLSVCFKERFDYCCGRSLLCGFFVRCPWVTEVSACPLQPYGEVHSWRLVLGLCVSPLSCNAAGPSQRALFKPACSPRPRGKAGGAASGALESEHGKKMEASDVSGAGPRDEEDIFGFATRRQVSDLPYPTFVGQVLAAETHRRDSPPTTPPLKSGNRVDASLVSPRASIPEGTRIIWGCTHARYI